MKSLFRPVESHEVLLQAYGLTPHEALFRSLGKTCGYETLQRTESSVIRGGIRGKRYSAFE